MRDDVYDDGPCDDVDACDGDGGVLNDVLHDEHGVHDDVQYDDVLPS